MTDPLANGHDVEGLACAGLDVPDDPAPSAAGGNSGDGGGRVGWKEVAFAFGGSLIAGVVMAATIGVRTGRSEKAIEVLEEQRRADVADYVEATKEIRDEIRSLRTQLDGGQGWRAQTSADIATLKSLAEAAQKHAEAVAARLERHLDEERRR